MQSPGGRWYIWRRWWLAEVTHFYIGKRTFKASSVMGLGPCCRRREHLAASVDDLVWVHASKKGRSCERLCGWLWMAIKASFALALAFSIMWSAMYPNCDRAAGCPDLTPDTIDYSNCAAECGVQNCANITWVNLWLPYDRGTNVETLPRVSLLLMET